MCNLTQWNHLGPQKSRNYLPSMDYMHPKMFQRKKKEDGARSWLPRWVFNKVPVSPLFPRCLWRSLEESPMGSFLHQCSPLLNFSSRIWNLIFALNTHSNTVRSLAGPGAAARIPVLGGRWVGPSAVDNLLQVHPPHQAGHIFPAEAMPPCWALFSTFLT